MQDFDKKAIMVSVQKTLTGLSSSNLYQNNLVGAQSDIEAILSWLEEFEDSQHTLRTYQKESLRFLLWCYHTHQLRLSELRKQHIHLYREFLANPVPQELWCRPMELSFGNKKNWQPFKGPLSENSIKVSMTILSGMFTYLQHAQYIPANPFKLIKKKNMTYQNNYEQKQIELVERILTIEEFSAMIATIDHMQDKNIQTLSWCQRAKFIFLFLAFTGLRVGELEQSRWGDLTQTQGTWWLKVLGKGNKLARVPINGQCYEVIRQYQDSIAGTLTEECPLVCQLDRQGQWLISKKLSSRSINMICKVIVEHLISLSSSSLSLQRLRGFSPHWLRHFSASQQALSDIPMHFIKAHHRHSKDETTRLYVHHENKDAHQASEKLDLLNRISKINNQKAE